MTPSENHDHDHSGLGNSGLGLTMLGLFVAHRKRQELEAWMAQKPVHLSPGIWREKWEREHGVVENFGSKVLHLGYILASGLIVLTLALVVLWVVLAFVGTVWVLITGGMS